MWADSQPFLVNEGPGTNELLDEWKSPNRGQDLQYIAHLHITVDLHICLADTQYFAFINEAEA